MSCQGVTGEEFLKIKHERTMERRRKAEAKRQQDLQRILDKKSRIGIHPLELFRKEIWENIFEFLTPVDLGAIMEVHDLFQEMLESRRIRDILFPQILGLKFFPPWNQQEDDSDAEDDDDDESIYMEEERALAFARFIELREVSKSLRNGIDEWHESEINRNIYSEKERKVASFTLEFPGIEDHDLELDRVLANFRDGGNKTKAKRCFLRSLKVSIKDCGYYSRKRLAAFTQFQESLRSLLEIVGKQMLRFEFCIRDLDKLEKRGKVPVSQVYVALTEWVELMPNLKWIVLVNEIETYDEGRIRIPEKIYRDYPFPHLEHLVRIHCSLYPGSCDKIFGIFSSAIKANPHIKALVVVQLLGDSGQQNEEFYENNLNPLLKSLPLDLEMFSAKPNCTDSGMRALVQPILTANWHLKRFFFASGDEQTRNVNWKIYRAAEGRDDKS